MSWSEFECEAELCMTRSELTVFSVKYFQTVQSRNLEIVPGSWDDPHDFDCIKVLVPCIEKLIFSVFTGEICLNQLIRTLVIRS